MFTCSRKCLFVLAAFVLPMLPVFLPGAWAGESPADETAGPVSPYFFVEGEDSGLDRLPLKKTAADVRLNGFIASVTLAQVMAQGRKRRNMTPDYGERRQDTAYSVTFSRSTPALFDRKCEPRQVFAPESGA